MRIDLSRVPSQYLFNFYPTAFFAAHARAGGKRESNQRNGEALRGCDAILGKLRTGRVSANFGIETLVQRLIAGLNAGDDQLDRDQSDDDDFQP
jgi:hypothetical protein